MQHRFHTPFNYRRSQLCSYTVAAFTTGLFLFARANAAAGTADTFSTGTSLLKNTNYTSQTLPSSTTDVSLTTTTSNPLTITPGTLSAVSMESLTTSSSTVSYTITNATTSGTSSTLTLGNAAGFTNANDNTANDLIAVTGSKNLTITGASPSTNTGTLGLILASSGNFDLSSSGTLTISSTIGQATAGTSLTITGAGTGVATLSGADSFSGGLNITGAEVDVTSDTSLGAAGGSVTINGGRLGITGSFTLDATRNIFLGANPMGGNTTGTLSISGSSSVITINNPLQNLAGSTGDLVKQGKGTLQLGGVSTYTGTTFLNNGTTQLISGSNRLPTSTIVVLGQSGSANTGTLDLDGNSQQIAGLNSAAGAGETTKNTVTTSTGSVTLTLGGSGKYAYGDGTATNSGVIGGAISLVKSGTGTQTLGDANTYTGSTTVGGGTLVAGTSISGSAVQALGGTTAVLVNGGGTLQMGAANQFTAKTPAPLTLNGVAGTAATFSVNGNSQGSTSANGVGALTLTANSAGNVIDFNSKNAVITFASLTTNGAALTINNYVNNSGAQGGPDELIFNQDQNAAGSMNLGNIVFSGYGASSETALGNGFYEVFPTAVPEPATWFGGILLVGAVGWNQRRRLGGLISARA